MEKNKLNMNFKKVAITIALTLVVTALILLLVHALTGGFEGEVREIEIRVEQPITVEERTKILRSVYEKRELTPEEEKKIEIVTENYKEIQANVDTLSEEYKQEQTDLLERLRVLDERQQQDL